ncbi:MAG: GNAT family N-acetyltransferase [Nocardioides sp.]
MASSERVLLRLVADDDGRVSGVCRVRRHGDRTMVQLQVRPEDRRVGVGTALVDEALARGDGPLDSIVNGDDGSLAAARRWGFVLGRELAMSAVDPRSVPAPSEPTVPLSDIDPVQIWRTYAAVAGDDPSGLSDSGTQASFLDEDWRHPDHRPDLGRAVVDGDRVLSFAMVLLAGARAWNEFTGTHPEARGNGLAHRVKAASLAALATAGATSCGTGNDARNEPMLAVNHALGYAPSATSYAATRAG